MADFKPWADFGNTQAWLKQTGIPTEEAGHIGAPPPFPYQVFFDQEETTGSDTRPQALIRHDISVEQYEENKTRRGHEQQLEALLAAEGLLYTKERDWLASEKMYMTTYDFAVFEKRGTAPDEKGL